MKTQKSKAYGAQSSRYFLFAYLLQFFNDVFHIDILDISTCYWTAQRVTELMQRQYNYDFLNYTVISLIETEQPTYTCTLLPINQFDPHTQRLQFQTDTHTFYEALERVTQRYTGQMYAQAISVY